MKINLGKHERMFRFVIGIGVLTLPELFQFHLWATSLACLFDWKPSCYSPASQATASRRQLVGNNTCLGHYSQPFRDRRRYFFPRNWINPDFRGDRELFLHIPYRSASQCGGLSHCNDNQLPFGADNAHWIQCFSIPSDDRPRQKS